MVGDKQSRFRNFICDFVRLFLMNALNPPGPRDFDCGALLPTLATGFAGTDTTRGPRPSIDPSTAEAH